MLTETPAPRKDLHKSTCEELVARLRSKVVIQNKTQELLEYLERAVYCSNARTSAIESFSYNRVDRRWDSKLKASVLNNHAIPSSFNRTVVYVRWARGVHGPTEISIDGLKTNATSGVFRVRGGMRESHFDDFESMIVAIYEHILRQGASVTAY